MRLLLRFTPILLTPAMWLGCADYNGIIELDSAAPSKSVWRTPPPVDIHVGEAVRMTFRTRFEKADYAVYHDSASDYYDDCGPPIGGRFEWTHTFVAPAGGQGRTRITVRAYEQQQRRDLMPVDGRLEDGSGPTNESDRLVATANVDVNVYQSEVRMTVQPAADSPDWGLSRLTLVRADGRSSRANLAGRERRGFSVSGPDKQGQYMVTYKPACDEINATGETEAELAIADQYGKTQIVTIRFPTP